MLKQSQSFGHICLSTVSIMRFSQDVSMQEHPQKFMAFAIMRRLQKLRALGVELQVQFDVALLEDVELYSLAYVQDNSGLSTAKDAKRSNLSSLSSLRTAWTTSKHKLDKLS